MSCCSCSTLRGGSTKRGGGAQRDGGSAVAAAWRLRRRWQRNSATSAEAWWRYGGGGSVSSTTSADAWRWYGGGGSGCISGGCGSAKRCGERKCSSADAAAAVARSAAQTGYPPLPPIRGGGVMRRGCSSCREKPSSPRALATRSAGSVPPRAGMTDFWTRRRRGGQRRRRRTTAVSGGGGGRQRLIYLSYFSSLS